MKVEYILKLLPRSLVNEINLERLGELEEIRVRVNRNTIFRYDGEEVVSNFVPNEEALISMLQMFCENSIYSYQSQICNGFVTIFGGHRVGVTGNIAMRDGKISNINYISSLNIRIAKEIIGAANKIIKYVFDEEDGRLKICNSLIISPPGYGKTTVLRDLTRQISNMNFNVSLIDERGEIAAMYKGVPQNDVGLRCDVMDNVTKSLGMKIAVRTMCPDVIIADEIGTSDDINAINYGICSGVKGIFTAHASSIDELILNENLNKLYNQKIMQSLIFLGRLGRVKKVYILSQNMYKIVNEKME